jgi:hypothetical protein
VIRFRFELTPLDQVQPWAGQLHWFALTDGVYWIDVSGHELLRYANDRQSQGRTASPFVDYYVARFWEDILAWAPSVLEPVPPDLVGFVASDREQWLPTESEQAAQAKSWYDDHALDLGYLRHAPNIRAWCTAHNGAVTMTWRHRVGGGVTFTATDGHTTMPSDAFRRAVREFDHDVITAMADRVQAVARAGRPSGVDIDIDRLRAEQAHRSTRHGVVRSPDTDWAAVRAGARLLAGLP